MPTNDMQIIESANIYELRRAQWRGNVARITKDPELLEEVKKYTWTYSVGEHPYLRNSKLGVSLHEFVLGYIYGSEHIRRMREAGNIIEHLDNNGLNCTYENLHILSENLNKTKAFSIDKMSKEAEVANEISAFIMDVYFSHEEKCFQMQVFLNDDIYFNTNTKEVVEMFICRYVRYENLYLDWFYLLDCRSRRQFDINKFHADKMYVRNRPYIQIEHGEENSPFIVRDGVVYLNLDAKKDGKPMVSLKHTSLRSTDTNF